VLSQAHKYSINVMDNKTQSYWDVGRDYKFDNKDEEWY